MEQQTTALAKTRAAIDHTMAAMSKPMWAEPEYDGSPMVTPKVKASRRAKNKQARKSRRANRR